MYSPSPRHTYAPNPLPGKCSILPLHVFIHSIINQSSVGQIMVFIHTIIVIEVLWHGCESDIDTWSLSFMSPCSYSLSILLTIWTLAEVPFPPWSRFHKSFHFDMLFRVPVKLSHFSFIWPLTRCYLVTSLLSVGWNSYSNHESLLFTSLQLFSNKI